jgi:RHS repeat-associated protein
MEYSDYYPDGMRFWTSTSNSAALPYRYNGKELEAMNGLNEYDYGARRRETGIPVWKTMDPLAEKYYGMSPYAYCMNNPVLYIDPFGLWTAVSGGYSTNDPNDISNFMGYYQSQQAVGNTNPTTNQMLNYVSDVVDNKQPHLSDGSLFISQVNVIKNPFGWEPEYKSYKTAWDEINQYQFRGKASVGGQNNVSDIDGIIGTGGDILGHVVNSINGASKLAQIISNTGKLLSVSGSTVSTFSAISKTLNGTADSMTKVDAGVGFIGLTSTAYTYYSGIEVPYVGEAVALYFTMRLIWDVSFNLGAKYGPMTYIVNHLAK